MADSPDYTDLITRMRELEQTFPPTPMIDTVSFPPSIYPIKTCCATREVANFRLHSPNCPAQTWVDESIPPSVHAHNLRFQFEKKEPGIELTMALILLFAIGVICGFIGSWWIW